MTRNRFIFLSCVCLVGSSGAASCRDFDVPVDEGQGRAGSEAAGGVGVGGFPPRGGSASGDASANQSGQSSGAASGDRGTGGSGALAPGDGGGAGEAQPSAGTGNSPKPTLDTGMFGAVRLFIDGQPVCGGTLLNNHWVLTADSCVAADDSDVNVAYGADSSAPDQIEHVKEVVRFPGNDGTSENRGRNLLLLGLAQPMRIGGASDGFFQPVLNMTGAGIQLGSSVCVGWDLTPELDDEAHQLRREMLTPFALDSNVQVGPREAGDWIWWSKQWLPGADVLALPTNLDVGIGCILPMLDVNFLASVSSGVPEKRRDGRDNPNLEARTTGVSEEAVRIWVEQTLTSEPDFLPLPALGPVAAKWSDPESLELLGVSKASGTLLWLTRANGAWGEAVDLGSPEGVLLAANFRPGGVWRNLGSVDVFAVDEFGKLWWKRRLDAETWTEWSGIATLEDEAVDTTITSGVAVGESRPGDLHLVARGAAGELRHARYEDGLWYDSWRNLGDVLVGEPTLDVLASDRVNVFYANSEGKVMQRGLFAEGWYTYQLASFGPIASAPAAAHWNLMLFDFVARSATGTLVRLDYRAGWFGPRWLDTGLSMPDDSDPHLALRHAGHGDLFVSTDSGQVWHVEWPRKP